MATLRVLMRLLVRACGVQAAIEPEFGIGIGSTRHATLDAAGIAQIAIGIDTLNDAALIVEWPLAGRHPRILHANAAFELLLGYERATAIGQTTEFLYGPAPDLERIECMRERVRTTLEARVTLVLYRRDGVPIWVDLSLRAGAADAQKAPFVVATLRDASTRKEFEFALAKEKRKLQVTLAAIGDGVITTVADGRIDYCNLAARAMLGVDAAEAYGEPIGEILNLCDTAQERIDVLHAATQSGDVNRGQAQLHHQTKLKDIAYVSSPIGSEGYVVVLRDVTAQQRLSTQLSYEASHDPLTSIFNRRKFEKLLDDAISSTLRSGGQHVLAFLDLDRFKLINDTCGHAVGDRVLRDVAHILATQLRGRDVLARLGGDEFAVLLHDCTLDNARRVLDKVTLTVSAYRLCFGGHEYGVGVSIGTATIDGSELEAATIVARADAACYAAKAAGRNALSG